MKIRIALIIFCLFNAPAVSASEIFGAISTDPDANIQQNTTGNTATATDGRESKTGVSGGAVPIYNIKQAAKPPGPISAEPVRVLGLQHYPDGSLLRADGKKIYLISGQIKRHIVSLNELKKYRCKTIYDVTPDILAPYTDGHLDGELIRQRGDAKVYVLRKGGKKHILNPEELRRYYFGREIFNISGKEMGMY